MSQIFCVTKQEANMKDFCCTAGYNGFLEKKHLCDCLSYKLNQTLSFTWFLGAHVWETLERGMELLGHGICACLTLGENFQQFSKAVILNCVPTRNVHETLWIHVLVNTWYYQTFTFFAQMSSYVVCLIMIFICIFLTINEVGCVHWPYILPATANFESA